MNMEIVVKSEIYIKEELLDQVKENNVKQAPKKVSMYTSAIHVSFCNICIYNFFSRLRLLLRWIYQNF